MSKSLVSNFSGRLFRGRSLRLLMLAVATVALSCAMLAEAASATTYNVVVRVVNHQPGALKLDRERLQQFQDAVNEIYSPEHQHNQTGEDYPPDERIHFIFKSQDELKLEKNLDGYDISLHYGEELAPKDDEKGVVAFTSVDVNDPRTGALLLFLTVIRTGDFSC